VDGDMGGETLGDAPSKRTIFCLPARAWLEMGVMGRGQKNNNLKVLVLGLYTLSFKFIATSKAAKIRNHRHGWRI
jgi:hypothetical protein